MMNENGSHRVCDPFFCGNLTLLHKMSYSIAGNVLKKKKQNGIL